MSKFLIALALLCSSTLFSTAQSIGKAMVVPSSVTKDALSLAYYKQDHLRLADDFSAFDGKSQPLTKRQFLKALTTGNYLPLRLTSQNSTYCYRLYKLNTTVSKDVKGSIAQFARTYLRQYEMEGKQFPDFHFVDLNGKTYDRNNTKGKILVLKSWFIACYACNEEMPKLNRLTDKYKDRKDILFVSITFDSEVALKRFVKKRIFKYAIVPVKESFIEQTLKSSEYPTHWIINRQGKIVKMVNNPDEMIAALSKEASL
jgi:peroxiredoxin